MIEVLLVNLLGCGLPPYERVGDITMIGRLSNWQAGLLGVVIAAIVGILVGGGL
jgi:hypothetical protein